MVARFVRDEEAGGSNPPTPTNAIRGQQIMPASSLLLFIFLLHFLQRVINHQTACSCARLKSAHIGQGGENLMIADTTDLDGRRLVGKIHRLQEITMLGIVDSKGTGKHITGTDGVQCVDLD